MITSPGFQKTAPNGCGAVEVMRHVVVLPKQAKRSLRLDAGPDRRSPSAALCEEECRAGNSIGLRRSGARSHDRAEHRHWEQGKTSEMQI
jgi:hypothetical protein